MPRIYDIHIGTIDGGPQQSLITKTDPCGLIDSVTSVKTVQPSQKISAGYYTIWDAVPTVTNVNQNFKWIILFEAAPVGGADGSGAISWDGTPPTSAQLATCRARGQKILISIGGATGDMNFTSRAKSQTCVNSIISTITALGDNVDGIDWDNYENIVPVTAEYLWMGQQLKAHYGSDFIIWSAVGPWKTDSTSASFYNTLISGGALDYVMPMYYADTVYNQNYILNNATEGLSKWGSILGGYDHICVGFGIDDLVASDYMTSAETLSTWNAAISAHPTLAGGGLWDIYNDIHQTSGAANSYATGTAAAILAS